MSLAIYAGIRAEKTTYKTLAGDIYRINNI
jgi:hypothetical protein